MPIPLVALQVQPTNIGGAFAEGQQAAQRNALINMQMQAQRRKAEQENALAQFYQQQGPGLLAGDENALAGLSRIDPGGALDLRGKAGEADRKRIEAAKTKIDLVSSGINAVLNAGEGADKQALWDTVRGNLETQYGIKGENVPQVWDENWAASTVAQGLTLKEQLDQSNNERDFRQRAFENSPVQQGRVAAAQAAARQPYELARMAAQQADDLIEVYDPTSPTGTRLVRKSAALGQPGKPGSGLKLTTGPNGEVELIQGPGAGTGSGLSRTTQTRVEEKIISSGDTLANLTAIDQKFKPEFQQIGTRWNNLVSSFRERAGFKLSEKESGDLREFTQYKREAGQLFTNTLKEMSGVAVNPTEMQRAQIWLPTPGTGLMDGDSPTELKAKIDGFKDFTRRALAKYSYIRKNGLDVNAVDVDQMPQIIQQRGDALAQEYGAKGLTGEPLKAAVRDRIIEEFGLGAR